MSEAKFTPGPWAFYVRPQPNGCPIVGVDGVMVAMLAHSVHDDEQHEQAIANARLIAASPQLYEALEDMFHGWLYIRRTHGDLYGVGWDRAEDKARAALAKAKGDAA